MGWIGTAKELLFYLDTVGADKDEHGKPLVAGDIIAGLGGDEVVVSDDAKYFVDGKPKQLAAGMATTSYGLAVKVF
jgi:hypothetical protein